MQNFGWENVEGHCAFCPARGPGLNTEHSHSPTVTRSSSFLYRKKFVFYSEWKYFLFLTMIDKFLIFLLLLCCPIFELRPVLQIATDSRPLHVQNHDIFFQKATPVKALTFSGSLRREKVRIFQNHDGIALQKFVTEHVPTDIPFDGDSKLQLFPYHDNSFEITNIMNPPVGIVDSLTTENVDIATYTRAELGLHDWYDNSTINTDSLSLYPRGSKNAYRWTQNKRNRFPIDYEEPIHSCESESMKNSDIPNHVVHVLGSSEELIPPSQINMDNSTIKRSTHNIQTGAEMPCCIGSVCK